MDANSYIHISNIDLLIALLFIAISGAISRWQKLELERDMAVGTIRAFAQLLAVGFVLQQLFDAAPLVLGCACPCHYDYSGSTQRSKASDRRQARIVHSDDGRHRNGEHQLP